MESRWLNPLTYRDDLPEELAREAFAGTSFGPEQRGRQAVQDHGLHMVALYTSLRTAATEGGTLALLDEEFPKFRAGYVRRYLEYLRSRTRFVSAFIVGPAKYPAARMARRQGVIERRLAEVLEFEQLALGRIRRQLRPDLAPIRLQDADAVQRLEVELERLKARQLHMKDVNAAIRLHAAAGEAAQLFALAALGYGPVAAASLLRPGQSWRSAGFQSYELVNNGANIRRVAARLAQVTEKKATKDSEIVGPAGVRLVEAPSENRVRLFFAGKPDEALRGELKKGGFRWTPSLGCWQAYHNVGAVALARRFAGLGARREKSC